MKNSNIQWTDYTWNIAVGCTKVDEDCKYCYMYRDSMKNTRYDPKVVRKTKTVFTKPLRIKEPSRIFVSSLTDVFHPEIDAFRDEMWEIIRQCPQHTFQILTKRPERIIDHLPKDWGDGWDNVWMGTSIGSEDSIHRVVHLFDFESKFVFLSIEPLHGPIDLRKLKKYYGFCEGYFQLLPGIDWVIIGGESGNETGKYRYRPCKLEWIRTIVEECQEADIPVFVKQLGTHLAKELSLKDRHGGDISEWPEDVRVREFPSPT
ncbi:DUF5131 family protein [Cyclobacterium jeungdonense]|uniref:DUF5131 family protein n=1 Tax=Cyclobacterium jeungdonense TaxID=708087 RepID=A0ABT8C8G9_9BACT|nr:DUF5131 family protein [Cyclobacterium jeungdonense]MDN3688667.1 DUF5131 family protein [Cyclobacterium jeungdonense]